MGAGEQYCCNSLASPPEETTVKRSVTKPRVHGGAVGPAHGALHSTRPFALFIKL